MCKICNQVLLGVRLHRVESPPYQSTAGTRFARGNLEMYLKILKLEMYWNVLHCVCHLQCYIYGISSSRLNWSMQIQDCSWRCLCSSTVHLKNWRSWRNGWQVRGEHLRYLSWSPEGVCGAPRTGCHIPWSWRSSCKAGGSWSIEMNMTLVEKWMGMDQNWVPVKSDVDSAVASVVKRWFDRPYRRACDLATPIPVWSLLGAAGVPYSWGGS